MLCDDIMGGKSYQASLCPKQDADSAEVLVHRFEPQAGGLKRRLLTRLQRKGVITVTHTQDALYSVYILQNRNREDHRMIQTSKKTRNSHFSIWEALPSRSVSGGL